MLVEVFRRNVHSVTFEDNVNVDLHSGSDLKVFFSGPKSFFMRSLVLSVPSLHMGFKARVGPSPVFISGLHVVILGVISVLVRIRNWDLSHIK